MLKLDPTVTSVAPRPVTPLGLIARQIDQLGARAASLGYTDAGFKAQLASVSWLAAGLDPYLVTTTTPPSPALNALATETARLDWPALYATGETTLRLEQEMLSGDVEGQFLNMLVHATGARRILEVGMFTGYSALAMAEALPADGTLIACEIDDYAANVARRAFNESLHGDKITIRRGPAAETLTELRGTGARFDLIFIDADKQSYGAYLNIIIDGGLLAPRGLICVDNTLMQGEPYKPEPRTAIGQAVADFNRQVAEDPRVTQVLLPIRDGLTLIRLN